MPGSGMVGLVTATVLRGALRVLAPIMFVGTAALLIHGAVITGRVSLISITLVGLSGVVAGWLLSRVELSFRRLRLLELALFGAVAAYLAVANYSRILDDVAAGDATLAVSHWYIAALQYILLVVIYGVFVPNPWPRTAAMVIPMAAMPFALGLLLNVRHPELSSFLAKVTTAERIASVMLLMIVGAVVAVFSAHLVDRNRAGFVRANVMGMYDLVKKIGVGGMGEVWLAKHHVLARPTAIKLIRPELLGDVNDEARRRALRRFEREAQVTAALRSPHTVELYDFGIAQTGMFYYVMEYLDGLDLSTLVERFGPVPVERAVHFLIQACDSLSDAHNNGLIHRDIKPANIYVCRMGTTLDYIKVLDFGLVKSGVDQAADTRITVEGTTTGTPAYMAPEMATASYEVDARSDLYALGCVGYWLLTGRPVFQSETPIGVLVEHAKTIPSPLSQRTEMPVPEELDDILLKCLEKDPANRFQKAEELSYALSDCSVSEIWDSARTERWWATHLPA
jgi:serine/threonine-protein kinase